MWNWIRVKYNHVLQNPNRARTKSYEKYKKTLEWYSEILAKQAKDWDTKWIIKTKEKAMIRIKRYWITTKMIADFLSSKWKSHLLSN